MISLHFAQISDIHISSLGDHHDMLSGQSAGFLTDILTTLNQIDDLDFVLISGDLFDTASPPEFERFQSVFKTLTKPCYIIPGNHDRREANSQTGLTRHDFARIFNPQVEARPAEPAAQNGYWSIAINAGVQLIGLDSIVDNNWNGVIDRQQLSWLKAELAARSDKCIILAVHHPLHKLAPIDDLPAWQNFVCDNGPELLALLDQHPQVKLVLTGHHHLAKADQLGSRLHLACPAVALYPCAYRTVRLTQAPNKTWSIAWQTHPATDKATIAEARQQMFTTWTTSVGFETDFVETHIDLAQGDQFDRAGQVIL